MADPGRPANQFLQSLSEGDYAAIAGDLREMQLKRDDVLNEVGAVLSAVYLPVRCILSVITVMEDGGQVESRTIGRESGYGLLHALGSPVAFERMVCQVGGPVMRLPLAALRAAAESRPSLTRAIVAHSQATYVQLAQTVACNALHPAGMRLARWLLMTRDRLESEMLPLTQEHLAIMLGVQRTTVTAVAQVLQAQGLVSYRRGQIRIRDHGGLRRASCECYLSVERFVDATLRATGPEADGGKTP